MKNPVPPHETEAYRGYLIRTRFIGEVWVEKDGFLICHSLNKDSARKTIDELLD